MNRLVLIALLVSLASCASKWKPKSSNPVANNENTLKTEWGYVKVDYDKTTDEGIFFNVEIKNESDRPISYQRGYITLLAKNGDKYQDLQNKYLTQNVTGAAKFAQSGNKLGVIVAGIKSLWQGAKVLGNGDIAPGAVHTDRLIYGKKSTKSNFVTLVFGPELVNAKTLNTISFNAE